MIPLPRSLAEIAGVPLRGKACTGKKPGTGSSVNRLNLRRLGPFCL